MITDSTISDRHRLAARLGYDVDSECAHAFNWSPFLPQEVQTAFNRGFDEGATYMFRLLYPHLPESITGPTDDSYAQPELGQPGSFPNKAYVRMLKTLDAHPADHLELRSDAIIGRRANDVQRAWARAYHKAFDDAIRLLYPYLHEAIKKDPNE